MPTNDRSGLTRRSFLHLGTAAAAAWSVAPLAAVETAAEPLLQEAISKLEYLTPLDRAVILDKGKAGVTKLPPEQLLELGLTPETWSLEVIPDPKSNSIVEQPLSRAQASALDWQGLIKLAQKHMVRFMHVCNCTNGPDPFHMSLWEGVPLRGSLRSAGPGKMSGGCITRATTARVSRRFRVHCRWAISWRKPRANCR